MRWFLYIFWYFPPTWDFPSTFLSGLLLLHKTGYRKFRTTLLDLSFVKENQIMLLPYRSSFTGSLLKSTSTTELLHLFSGTLRILSLPTFPNCFKPVNPPELFGPATKNWKIPQINLKSAGNRSFRCQAVVVWNCLPIAVRNSLSLSSLKTNLKKSPVWKALSPPGI